MSAPLVITPCQPSDSRNIWLWRNDDETRRLSKTTEEIAWEDHEKWFTAALANPDKLLLIGRIGDDAVGTVRFDALGLGVFQVSINLNPLFRNKGFGKKLLSDAMDFAIKNKNAIKFIAEVKNENTTSNKLFLSLGFRLTEVKDDMNIYLLKK